MIKSDKMTNTNNNCQIENMSIKIVKYIKNNKLLLSITISINLAVCIFCFTLWYLYTHSLPVLKDTDKLSAICNLFTTLGTIALAIFGWVAYRYATKQYLKNEITKLKFQQKYQIICDLIKISNNAYRKYEVICSSKYVLINSDNNQEDTLNEQDRIIVQLCDTYDCLQTELNLLEDKLLIIELLDTSTTLVNEIYTVIENTKKELRELNFQIIKRFKINKNYDDINNILESIKFNFTQVKDKIKEFRNILNENNI